MQPVPDCGLTCASSPRSWPASAIGATHSSPEVPLPSPPPSVGAVLPSDHASPDLGRHFLAGCPWPVTPPQGLSSPLL